MNRAIPIESPLCCGICRRPVTLLRAAGTAWLVEDQEGEKVPHACPELAVKAWIRASYIHRLASRSRQQQEDR